MEQVVEYIGTTINKIWYSITVTIIVNQVNFWIIGFVTQVTF